MLARIGPGGRFPPGLDALAALGALRRRPWLGRVPEGLAEPAGCNVCGWRGERFRGTAHSESAVCPTCGSIARDRFAHWCLWRRVEPGRRVELLETSPRLGRVYRATMRSRVRYRSSDLYRSSHHGDLVLDLQRLDLPDASLDVVLTCHVLEHVPDIDRALSELARVLRPGGAAIVQVPVLQGRTGRPHRRELHEDRSPVHWRFGLDLAERMRGAGLEAETLVVEDLARRARTGDADWPSVAPEFDPPSIVEAGRAAGLVSIADGHESRVLGFEPSYMFVAWHLRRPPEERAPRPSGSGG